MNRDEIRQHWTDWANTYGGDLRATTKAWTPKLLELDALARRIRLVAGSASAVSILEVGCGNGINCIELAKLIPGSRFDGVDLIPEMVNAATENSQKGGWGDRLRFFTGDAVAIQQVGGLEDIYDIVFTDRCLINLNTIALQKQGIAALAAKVRPGGYLLMIENSLATYEEQNRCRQMLGLKPRTPAAFNLFFEEIPIRQHIAAIGLDLVDVEDFISLHDLLLYVLIPAVNGGEVDYDHPLVHAAMILNKEMSSIKPGAFGTFGQNRLFVCHKPE
jgi:SAM-dependent methyltransferase